MTISKDENRPIFPNWVLGRHTMQTSLQRKGNLISEFSNLLSVLQCERHLLPTCFGKSKDSFYSQEIYWYC